jgi:hypothetical protein
MTSRRYALHELSAYRARRRRPYPWQSVRWGHVLLGFAIIGAPIAMLIVALVGMLG